MTALEKRTRVKTVTDEKIGCTITAMVEPKLPKENATAAINAWRRENVKLNVKKLSRLQPLLPQPQQQQLDS